MARRMGLHVIVLAFSMVVATAAAGPAQDRNHLLVREKGTVQYRGSTATEWNSIISTRFIGGDQVVRTQAASKGHLQFFISDSHVARVALLDNVQVSLDRLSLDAGVREVVLSQKGGRIYVDASVASGQRQRFTVQTPSATIAVRGTRFYSDVADDGTTTCGCAEGSVEVTGAGKTVRLKPGFFTTVRPGAAPDDPRWDVREFGPQRRRSGPAFVIDWDVIFVPGRGTPGPGRTGPGMPPPGHTPTNTTPPPMPFPRGNR